MPNVLDYHIGRLKDKNPDVRARSAYELGLLGDPSVLPILEELYRTETDPTVKRAAQNAGWAILSNNQAKDGSA